MDWCSAAADVSFQIVCSLYAVCWLELFHLMAVLWSEQKTLLTAVFVTLCWTPWSESLPACVTSVFTKCLCLSLVSPHFVLSGFIFTAVVSSFSLHSLVSLSFLGADLIIWYRMSYYLNDHIHYIQSQVKWCTWMWVMDICFLVNYPVHNWTHNIHVWGGGGGGGGLNIFLLLPVQNCTHGMHTVWVKTNSCSIIYAVLQVCWFLTKIQTHKRFKRCCFVGQNTTCKFTG